MKVLYLSYDGMTDPLGQSQVLPYLKLLSKQGYKFTIISFEKKARYEKEAKTIQAIVDEANIDWVPLFFTAKPPMLAKIYDRWRMWQMTLRLHKLNEFNLIHCRSYIAAEMGLRLKQKFGVKMLFDMRGFWADEKVDNGQWDLKNPLFKNIYRHYKKKEKEFLLQADGIVSLTGAAKEYLLRKKEYKHLSIEVIPCCADLEHFNFQDIDILQTSSLKSYLGIPSNAKVITYLGSIGGWYMTKEMFDFFKKLEQSDPSFVMLILTKDNPAVIKEEVMKMGININKVFITYSERKKIPIYLSLSDWSIFFIRNTFSKIASSPTKHAELMGMGIPVICNDIGDTGRIIEGTRTGLVLREFNDENYLKIIEQVKKPDFKRKDHIRNSAFEFFDLYSGVKSYLNIYKRLLN